MNASLTSGKLLAFACLCLSPWPAFAETAPGHKMFGRGNPFTVEELPAGHLKSKLETLGPEARQKALDWLHTMSFAAFDAARHLRVDNHGGIYTVCSDRDGNCKDHHHDAAPEASNTVDTAPAPSAGTTTGGASVPVATPPAYNSKPGATKHIYLDFNGAIVSGTAWNSSAGVSSWNVKVWSQDGDRTTFNDAEQAWMKNIWQRVAEDYAPFDINVTTDVAYDPVNYNGNKDNVGWLLICETTDNNNVALPHAGSGGVAYVGVFGETNYNPTYQPAWVTSTNGGGDPDIVAEAASHEMGHNMGLSHDGLTSGAAYYGGHGTGSISWGPIMGVGYGRNVSQWSKGEYYLANETEDDLDIISDRVAYRADDHGNSNAAATALTVTAGTTISSTTPQNDPANESPENKGIIETNTDVDVFAFETGAGAVQLNVNPWKQPTDTFGGNLDVSMELYNEQGDMVASNNPETETYAGISMTLPAGIYYLHVKNSGAGNPKATSPTGYTSYGSLGQYFISGTIIDPIPMLRIGSITPRSAAFGSTVDAAITGTLFESGTTVRLRRSGSPDVIGTSVQFNSPTSLSCQFNLSSAAVGKWDVEVRNPDNATATLTNGFTITMPVGTLFSENFDATTTMPANWSAGGWSIVSTSSQSPTRSAYLKARVAASSSYLTSPAIPISAAATDLQLSFWHAYNMEDGFDGGRIEFSLDGGDWFGIDDEGSGASFSRGSYDRWISYLYNSPIMGKDAWTGDSSGYIQTVIDFTDEAKYAGKTLRIRWQLATDAYVGGTGWNVDSVLLTGTNPGGTLEVSSGDYLATGSQGGPFTPASKIYTLSNNSSSPVSWTATKTADWLTLSATSGTLAGNSSTQVTVSINSNANSLAEGDHEDTVTFNNITNGFGTTTRNVSLSAVAGTLHHFAISSIASPQSVGSAITGITITAQNAANETVTSFTGTVEFGGTAGVTGTSASFVAGVLSDVSITPTVAGSDLTFTVDDGSGHTGSATIATIHPNYSTWGGGFDGLENNDPDADFDGGGLTSGLEWALGGNPTNAADDAGLAPIFDSTDADFFIYTYRRSDAAHADASTSIAMQYSSSMTSWNTAVHDGTNVIISVTNDGAGTGIDLVEVKIRRSLATDNRLFAKLIVTVSMPD